MKTFTASILLLTILACLSMAQNVSIPDTAFLYALIEEGVDVNGDSLISISEAEAITKVYVPFAPIYDMTGIEKFVNLDTLICYNTPLTSLDVSNCTALKYLDVSARCYFVGPCGKGVLKTLDVSNNPTLEELYCDGNMLTSLDVPDYTALKELNCGGNQLTSLNVSECVALKKLFCSGNELTSLDATGCKALTELSCIGNQLSSLDLSSSVKLMQLDCYANQLSTLDLSNNPTLLDVDCKDNQLTSLIFSENSALEWVICQNNQLSSLNVSNFIALRYLRCSSNELYHLDVSGCNSLGTLNCSNNQLDSLDVSSCTNLDDLDCSWNQLSRLDLSNNLVTLQCGFNQLTSLDVSKNTGLEYLGLSFNETLNEVCVWTTSFPPAGVSVHTLGSPVCFETDCNGACNNTSMDLTRMDGFSIYPNPTNDLLTIQTNDPGQHFIEITSLNGQLLFNDKVEGPTHQINLYSFQKGLYFITIRSQDYVRTEKIIKQ